MFTCGPLISETVLFPGNTVMSSVQQSGEKGLFNASERKWMCFWVCLPRKPLEVYKTKTATPVIPGIRIKKRLGYLSLLSL
jgi:hypothetical protein